jgi:hypothetical protein
MNEDYTPLTNVESVIDAEAVLYEVEPRVNQLLSEFKPKGYAVLQFPYVNEADELTIVSVAGSGLRDITTHYSVVTDKDDRYRLIASRTPGETDDQKSLRVRVQTWNKRAEVYVDAEERDVIRVGKMLDQLDIEKIREYATKLEEERKAHRGKWAGKILGGSWRTSR